LTQGLRFGLYVGVMIGALESLVWYVVLPVPAALAAGWFLAYVAMSLAAGAAVGVLCRQEHGVPHPTEHERVTPGRSRG
jgi:hypothetical protein